MFFSSSEQRARSAAFDTLIDQTDEVLCRPAVLKALGEQAAQWLLGMNQASFLPNFRNGVIDVTPRQLRSDGAGVLPLSEAEAVLGVRFSKEAYLPEPSRLHELAGANPGVVAQAYADSKGNEPYVLRNASAVACASFYFYGRVCTPSRPFILTWHETVNYSDPEVAALMTHEYFHTAQFRDRQFGDWRRDPLIVRANDELEAYNAMGIVLDATNERTGPFWNMVCHTSRLRETWGMDPLGTPTMELAQALQNAGLVEI